jgi:hypothetical protein
MGKQLSVDDVLGIGKVSESIEEIVDTPVRELNKSYRYTAMGLAAIIIIAIAGSNQVKKAKIDEDTEKIKAIANPKEINLNIQLDGKKVGESKKKKNINQVKKELKEELKETIKPNKDVKEVVEDMKKVVRLEPSDSPDEKEVKIKVKKGLEKFPLTDITYVNDEQVRRDITTFIQSIFGNPITLEKKDIQVIPKNVDIGDKPKASTLKTKLGKKLDNFGKLDKKEKQSLAKKIKKEIGRMPSSDEKKIAVLISDSIQNEVIDIPGAMIDFLVLFIKKKGKLTTDEQSKFIMNFGKLIGAYIKNNVKGAIMGIKLMIRILI